MYESDLERNDAVDELYSLHQDDQERAEAAAREARDEDEAMSQISTTYVPRAAPEGLQEWLPKRSHDDPSSEVELPSTIKPGLPDLRAHSGHPGKGVAYCFVREGRPSHRGADNPASAHSRHYGAIGDGQPLRSTDGLVLPAFSRLAEEAGAAATSDGSNSNKRRQQQQQRGQRQRGRASRGNTVPTIARVELGTVQPTKPRVW